MTWIQTAKGRAFDLLNPSASDVDFDEIAFALAHINRFTGHAGVYSVAQHCAHGCDYLLRRGEREAAIAFLLHDAHEAYVGDISTPVKQTLGRADGFRFAWHALVVNIDVAIHAAAGRALPSTGIQERVRAMDLAMLRTERDQLMHAPPHPWDDTVERADPLPIRIDRIAPEEAKRRWLGRFNTLR